MSAFVKLITGAELKCYADKEEGKWYARIDYNLRYVYEKHLYHTTQDWTGTDHLDAEFETIDEAIEWLEEHEVEAFSRDDFSEVSDILNSKKPHPGEKS